VGLLLSDEVLFRLMETLFDAATAPLNSDTIKVSLYHFAAV
jgi:hypothetical protein